MSLLLFDPPKPPETPLFALNHPCDPRGKSRPKAGRTGRVCRSCGTRTGSLVMRNNPADLVLEAELERAAREAMFRQGLHRLTVPLFCLVVARFPRVQDMPDRSFSGRQWRAKTPDFDNVGKLVTDALNGVVYGDDRQIVDGRIQTVFSATWEKPGIEVYLWEATPFPPELERAPQLEGACSMQLPDYLSSGSAEVFLDGVKFNRQTNDDEETQLGFFDATIDLVLDLTNRTLEDPPRYLRGAAEAVLAAKDGKGSTVVRYAPLDRERSVRLSLNRGIWEAFNDVGAEVRVLEVVATAKSPRFKAKVRVVGLSSVQCGALLECAKRTVHVSFEPVQIALNLVG